MDVFNVIKNRRSVRSFSDKGVGDEKIGKILEAASLAPSSGNIQNWQFIVVKDANKKEVIAEACRQNFLLEAPVIIVICDDKEKIELLFGEKGKEFYAIQNCALATENLLLAATGLDLATCFTAVFDEEAIKRELEVPENVSIDGVIALGYSKEKERGKRLPLKLKTYFEKFGNFIKPSIFPLKKFKK